MAITVSALPGIRPPALAAQPASARISRLCLLVAVAAAAVAGFTATGQHDAGQATAVAGPELTRLLRAMAGLKLLFAAAAIGAIAWRLAMQASWTRLAAYTLACAAMAAGPGLIWDMAHVRLGALLLHGGLLASVLLLWRDPATATLLHRTVAARRARLAG